MADFFVSYNSADLAVAESIATAFRDAGYQVRFAPWEVGIGDDIAAWMMEAMEDAERCIGVFSPDYLKKEAPFSAEERETYWWQKIQGRRAAFIPVIVRECTLPIPLQKIRYFDLRKMTPDALVAEYQAHPMHTKNTVHLNKQTLERLPKGREQDVANLHNALAKTGRSTILHGDGGIGKTTLARYFIHQHHADYDGVLWCDAQTRSSLIFDLCRLYAHIKQDILPDEQKTESMVKALFDLMGTRSERWLFVFDNIPDYATLRDLIPPGHLIVTTRASQGWGDFAVMHPDVLAYKDLDDPAIGVLMETSERHEDREGARDLAETLGGLPLALVIAGNLLRRERDQSFATFAAQVDEILEDSAVHPEYPRSIRATVQLSYDTLSADAKLVADVFAWWAPEGLEAALITGAVEEPQWGPDPVLTQDVIDLAQDAARVAGAIAALEERSLLRRDGSGYAMHRMTAAALRALQAETAKRNRSSAAAALLAALYPSEGVLQSENWPLCRRLTPHVRALWGSGDTPKIAAMDYLLNQAGIFFGRTGDNGGEIGFKQASLELKSARLGEEHRDIAVGHANLGLALQRAGDLSAAEEAFRRAVALDAEHRPDTVDLAESHDLLGGLLLDKGRAGDRAALWEALKEYQRAAAILRRHLPRLSDGRAQVLNNLGTLRDTMGQGAAGQRLAEYSLAIWQKILPAGDARLGYAFLNVGSMAQKSGAADRAEELLEQGMAIWRGAYLPEELPRIADVRTTAQFLVACYLTRAREGEGAPMWRDKARALCQEFSIDFDVMVEDAKQFPYSPTRDP